MLVAAVALALIAPAAQAEQRIALASGIHTATVTVTVGKTEDVRTDQNLTDITVGDPDVADVNPLTDHALSILGKKIGTTRVTVYGPDKKPVGIFDVEVSYDISRLATEISRFTGGGIRVSSVNGRIMLSGTVADAATLDKAVQIARQFGPDPINTVQVLQPQQIMLEVRFIEADRQASRELGVQWNMFGNSAIANVGSGLPASQLPITQPNGAFQQPGTQQCRRRQRAGEHIADLAGGRRRRAVGRCRRSAFWSANCRTGSRSRSTRSKRRAPRAASPSPIWWRCRAIPRASSPAASFPFRCPARSARSRSTTRNTASASPSRRPCSTAV